MVEILLIYDKYFKEMGVDIQKGLLIRFERYFIFLGKNVDEGGYFEVCYVGNFNDFLLVFDYEYDDWLELSLCNGYLDVVRINDYFGNLKCKDDVCFKYFYE